MKKTLTIIGCTVALLAGSAQAVVLTWNFTDDNATVDIGTPINFALSDISIGNTNGTVADPVNSTSASSGYAGASGTGNIGNAMRTGALITGAGGSGYWEFTINPDPGFTFTLSNFDFGARSTSTGSQAFSLRSSKDSFTTDLFTGTIANVSTWALKDNSVSLTSGVDETITFRLFGFNGTGAAGAGVINTRLDDITITVDTTAVPEPSTWALLGLGSAAMLYRLRRKFRLNS